MQPGHPAPLTSWRAAFYGVVLSNLFSACVSVPSAASLDIATTTSVKNSGVLDAVLPQFSSGPVHVHATRSGRALEMLDDGIVDVVITQAPRAEARYLASHPTWVYRKFAYNRFVVIGPREDPAGVGQAATVADAFRRIAASPMTFVSRGDQSGAHEKEQALWAAAGVTLPSDRRVISGSDMSSALRHTDERQGYTLSDEATYRQLRPQLDLVELFSSDPLLVNTYAITHSPENDRARAFADWLRHGEGRSRVGRYRVGGYPVFLVWPNGCDDSRAEAQPCVR